MIKQKVLANNFIQIRKAYGMSKIELAERCCLTSDEINNIELGTKTITPNELIQVAGALNCNPCDLLLFISKETVN